MLRIKERFSVAEEKKIVLQPRYMKDFACIGSACTENCCDAGWGIMVEKALYQKYRNLRDREWRNKFSEFIKRDRKAVSPSAYAKIKLTAQGTCPFLNEERLCEVQKKLGENYLSTICVSYPRIGNLVDGNLEKSLTMSCPEAIRKALMDPGVMEFDEVGEAQTGRIHIQGSFQTESNKPIRCPQQFFWQLRIFTISLLQNRTYALWQRLIILGLFYQKLEQLFVSNDYEQVIPLLEQYEQSIHAGVWQVELDAIPTELTLQMEILKELSDELILTNKMNPVIKEHFMRCFIKFLHGVGYHEGEQKVDITSRYQEAYKCFYNPFMQQYEHVLEHYLVNHVFQRLFPFSGYGSVFKNYIMLVLHYSIIKMLMIGTAGYEKEAFNQENVIQIIQTFTQNIGHSPKFLTHLFKIIEQNEMDNMAYMAILIKN